MLRFRFNGFLRQSFMSFVFLLLLTLPLLTDLRLVANATLMEEVVGIKQGDWIEYTCEWITPPPSQYAIWIRREILEVRGTIITVNVTTMLNNGTLQNEVGEGDIAEGTGLASIIFIPANLGRGDLVSVSVTGDPEDVETVQIIAESTSDFLGVERAYIYGNFSSFGLEILVIWDKKTGVALDIATVGTNQKGETKVSDTNIWESEPESSNNSPLDFRIIVLIVAISFSAMTIILVKYSGARRRKPRRKRIL